MGTWTGLPGAADSTARPPITSRSWVSAAVQMERLRRRMNSCGLGFHPKVDDLLRELDSGIKLMRFTLKRAALLAATAALPCATPAWGQSASLEALAVNSVVRYRLVALDDPLPFARCKVEAALHGDTTLAGLDSTARALLAPCGPELHDRVVLDTIWRAGDTLQVRLGVMRNHHLHYETYSLVTTSVPAGTLWVREVRLSGDATVYPTRPGGLQPPP